VSLKDRIQEDRKVALRGGDKVLLPVIGMLLAAIKQREVDERTETTDAHVLKIVEKLVKQRQESAVQFAAGNRPDLQQRELAEAEILKAYLPAQMAPAELDALIEQALQEAGAASMKDMGKVMALLRDRAQGRADFAVVGERVKARLAAAAR
jgi:uncharacterized protein YqeY